MGRRRGWAVVGRERASRRSDGFPMEAVAAIALLAVGLTLVVVGLMAAAGFRWPR